MTTRRYPTRRVMVQLLVAENVPYAGWFNDSRLKTKYNEVFGNFMNGGFGRSFSVVTQPGYLPGDRKGKGSLKRNW